QLHCAHVESTLTPDSDNPDKLVLKLTIHEGPRSILKRVYFKGCKQLPERKLRNIVLTREDWLLKFLDNAGVYKQEFIDMDKMRIEYFYRDSGYLNAKVFKTDVVFSDDKKTVSITFHIKEGPQFIVRSINAPGDELFAQDELLPLISLQEGKPYAQKQLVDSIERLKDRWGAEGYIYADVYPQIKPDATKKVVDITFHVERGNKMYVNRINITGNQATRDKVIRRQLDIVEGDLITTPKLNISRNNVEYLSFFEKDGVNWQVHRLTDSLADLEMNVKETKTGNFNFMLSYGSDKTNPRRSLRASIAATKSNLFGLGYDTGLMFQADRHHIPQKIEFHFVDPHIFDSNVSGAYYLYRRIDEFEGWTNVSPSPVQKVLGANFRFGFGLPQIDRHLHVLFDVALERVRNNDPHATGNQAEIFEAVVRREFQKGSIKTFGLELIKDTRNHQIYPCEGYKMSLGCHIAPPLVNHRFSFIKTEMEASSYTGLIGRDSLVLGLHGMLGVVRELGHKDIPYKDLFIMGGQNTVRGFVWGGVGPSWVTGEPLGARNAMLFRAELIFPLAQDYGMKGHFFYDAGAGWDTPKNSTAEQAYVRRDSFDLRHSIGFGINLMRPMPAKIDWGFKLDRRKHRGESAQEFHLGMNTAF
ncbi:MAG: outer membrane protein assembly factor BamA, partial [Candidatus Babeliales bacterium]